MANSLSITRRAALKGGAAVLAAGAATIEATAQDAEDHAKLAELEANFARTKEKLTALRKELDDTEFQARVDWYYITELRSEIRNRRAATTNRKS